MAGTQAVDRGAQLLVRVVESARALAVGELADACGLPKSTTSRLVGALERQGLVQRDGDRGTVRPGPVLLRFAEALEPAATLVDLADRHLDALAAESGETVNLAVLTPLGVAHLAQRDSRHFVGVANWVGRNVPLHCTANGKVFLAFGAAPVPEQLEARTRRTIVDRAELETALGRIRARGYATAVDELELGLSALAAPVRGPRGDVVAALSVSGPTIRMTRRRLDALAPLLLEHTPALSARLGHKDGAERGAA